MKPILYTSVTEGAVPTNYGAGVLCDCISCKVTEERNGSYELEMEYAAEGLHAKDIEINSLVKAKPNFTDEPQLFRVYKVGKVINGRFDVFAQHISYDLSGKLITTGSAGSCVAACALLEASAGNFTITTDKSVTANFRVSEPSSVRSWFGGKAGSLLDVYGGEWSYNNYTASLKQARGADRGVTIRYGKNLTDLKQEVNMENLCTGVVPYYIDQDGNQTVGAKVLTGLTLDVPRDIAIDFSSDVNTESSTPILTQLATLATNYVNKHNLTNPTDSIELDFVQLSSLQERVDLCDTVHIYFDALGISASAKCIETVWDVLEERYTSTTFGDARTSIADTILSQQEDIKTKPSTSMMEEAVERATKLITGNLGGFVVIHDSNGDGEPDEILIMNTADISTATKVWRWNQNGLGYSSTGYSGSYGLAMTADGEIVADFITTGTMSANRVRTGLISSTNNALQIDLDNGTITAPSITLSGQDLETTIDSLVQTSVVSRYALSNSGTVIPSAFPLTSPTQPTEQQPYLWTRTVYTYANGQTNTSYTLSVRGSNGTNGQDGRGLAILGNYDTMAELIAAHPTGSAGDAYLVGTDLVVWDTQTNSWKDVGRIQGPSGSDGLWLAIDNDDDGTALNVTYTAHLIKGLSNDVTQTFDSVFVWQLVNEDGVTEIATDTPTITVARDSANYGSVIRCICIAIVDTEVLQDYGYNTIQDYSGNDIEIISENNVKLIGEAAIYKPYAISSQFQVLSDEISARVTQTDFNSLSGTVTTQGTLIQQNASAILLKADTTVVNTQLNGKMGTDMSNRSSSILIDSGQIRFDSNSLVVNSSQFTLDANGNAVFKGKLNAAELYIGGEYVGLGNYIDDAEDAAISAAATDATNKANAAVTTATNAAAADATSKANAAKSSAISTAAADATSKANTAQSNAISAAASDATTKANNALTAANNYTNTGLAGKVGNNEIRTKFAADTHSITIQSGTIAFTSNTLSIDATNLKVTTSGLVTANKFTAKDEFSLKDASGNSRGYFKYPSTGTHFALVTSAAREVAELWDYSGAGRFQLKNSSDTVTVYAGGDTGNITATGKISGGSFGPVASTGAVSGTTLTASGAISGASIQSSGTIYAGGSISSSGNVSATGSMSCNGFIAKGQLNLYNNSNARRGILWVGGNDDGVLTLYNSLGNPRANIAGHTGILTLNNANGDTNIYMYGQNGNVDIAGELHQGSSRKIKKNIEPIEDSEKILELEAVAFDYIDEAKGTDKRGFIAEDVAEILPNLVTPETEDKTASLNYIGMIPYLQDVIKKQEARIKALEDKLEELTAKES